jgi:hypothetical protein
MVDENTGRHQRWRRIDPAPVGGALERLGCVEQ